MNEGSSVTQCPHCKTAFHIARSQLDAAHGKVRCGSCLEIFDALLHFVVEQKHLFDKTAAEDQSTDQDEQADDGPIILGDYNPDAGLKISRAELLRTVRDSEDSMDKIQALEQLGANYSIDDAGVVTWDGSIEDELAEEISNEASDSLESEVAETELAETELVETELVETELTEDELKTEGADQQTSKESVDENPDIEPTAKLDEPEESGTSESGEDTENTEESISAFSNDDKEQDSKPDSESEPESEALAIPSLDQESEPSSDFFIAPEKTRRGIFHSEHWGWKASAAAFCVLFMAELLYIQPDMLRQKPWFQSFTYSMCSVFPCTPKPLLDINQLRVSANIDDSPSLNGILTAYIELDNQADVRQGYPKIAIYFKDLRDKITASRVFHPNEYLKGEALTMGFIPTDRPVQIELSFVDPGEFSTSYEILLLP